MEISLAQWSLHRRIESGALRGLDFPRFAAETFGIRGVELVNGLLEASDDASLDELRRQADDHGSSILLLMIDDEGDLAADDESERHDAVLRHGRWIEAAARLGCRALRVNAGAEDRVAWNAPLEDPIVDRALAQCARSCEELCGIAAPHEMDVLLENHGGLSSNVPAVVEIARRLETMNFGTLPDFGNCPEGSDRYETVTRMMPWARAVSAKCHDFDADGNECTMDFPRLLDIVREAGYDGWLGIEYEGERLDEIEGVRACQALLERLLG